MATRGGRKPAPTALKVVRGDRPSRINHNAPPTVPPSGEVPPPAWLNEVAAEVWTRILPQLAAKRIMDEAHLELFAQGCQAIGLFQDAARLVNDQGIIVNNGNGKVKNPAFQVMRDSFTVTLHWSREFGLTPSAQSGITVRELEEGAADQILSG